MLIAIVRPVESVAGWDGKPVLPNRPGRGWASVSFVDKLSLGRLHLLRKVLLEGHRRLVAECGV